ncbi:hypothetical protein [Streptomyces adelaidensis]|uniref:hypothetical protein n=1 Tax=Streptomyces adelaidensis TaxID=2796465 RepID=UPI001907406F|nr:hypothetical protein [Streptomyces adelaidensis]
MTAGTTTRVVAIQRERLADDAQDVVAPSPRRCLGRCRDTREYADRSTDFRKGQYDNPQARAFVGSSWNRGH